MSEKVSREMVKRASEILAQKRQADEFACLQEMTKLLECLEALDQALGEEEAEA
jgi:hypothetical protein